ncbi:hypothetical protein DFH07DRAFT_769965 [Mycena maculata]|uniref:Uncharacterized protein n=1 Tax=Mycena maculata TaxID=230809 RepID=A0AAD7JIX9_9AGAR|nr:hypothetical protein DFH07DRAFT_769965 [Mycena maculata]
MTQQEHDHETRTTTAESNQNHDGKPRIAVSYVDHQFAWPSRTAQGSEQKMQNCGDQAECAVFGMYLPSVFRSSPAADGRFGTVQMEIGSFNTPDVMDLGSFLQVQALYRRQTGTSRDKQPTRTGSLKF